MTRTQSEIGKSNVRRGKSLERRVAHLFTDWSGHEFRRRRIEGRDTQTIEIDSTADVIPVGINFLFSVEVKCGAGFSLDALLANPKNCILTKWFHQCVYDAQLLCNIQKRLVLPLLFFKPHPNNDWVAISSRAFENNGATNVALPIFPHLRFDHYSYCGPITMDVSHTKNKKLVELLLDPMILCRWNDFKAHVDPNPFFGV